MKTNLMTAAVCLMMAAACNTISQEDNDILTSQGQDELITGMEEQSPALAPNSIRVKKVGWSVRTKAFSRGSLTTPDFNIGDEMCVYDSLEGKRYKFEVVENNEKDAVITSKQTELIPGHSYRILYPNPKVSDKQYCFAVGFGTYEASSTLDWLYSDYKVCGENGTFEVDLKRLNSAIIVNFVSPADCVVKDIRFATDTCAFLIKGALSAKENVVVPERTTWVNKLQIPHQKDTLVKGEKYSYLVTLYPGRYSEISATFELYTHGNMCSAIPVAIPDLAEGDVIELNIGEMGEMKKANSVPEITYKEKYYDKFTDEK